MNKHNAIQAAERVTASEEEGVGVWVGFVSKGGEVSLGACVRCGRWTNPLKNTAAAEPEPELTTQ